VDAMSSFGAIPVDIRTGNIDYLISSANKCIEGVPGFGFVLAKKSQLTQCKGNAANSPKFINTISILVEFNVTANICTQELVY